MYSDSVGNYFMPNIPLAVTTAGVLLEMDIGAASADHGEMLCVQACKVTRLKFFVVGELAGGTSAAPTVIFKKRPTPLSATSETTLGTLTIPDATAVGKVIYKDIDPISFSVGDSVEISHTVGTGTPTGKGFWSFDVVEDPEYVANESDMIASA